MIPFTRVAVFGVAALLVAGCSGGGVQSTPIVAPATTVPPATSTSTTTTQSFATVAAPEASLGIAGYVDLARGLASGLFKRSCEIVPGELHCHAIVRSDSGVGQSAQPGPDAAAAAPSGYGPATLQAAYGITSAAASGGAGRTVAIVDAYDAPTLESDLGKYRAQYGLPACTTANGCFKKVNQTGGTSLPRKNASWAQETSLDVDMVSANCPNCHILVLEATSPTTANLATAVDTAAKLGASAISNSYGGSESSADASYASYYTHAGIAITASAGDSGYGTEVPAAYGTVVATGGTTLNASSGTETVWNGSGSGCSTYEAKPSWQHDTGCAKRTISDVAYDADPNSGVAVYDSTPYQGQSGWLVFGGTSVASPAIAAIYTLAGDAFGTAYPASFTYAKSPSGLYDVTSGSNGSCGGSYLCTGKVGYDGPTGLGSPRGLTAF